MRVLSAPRRSTSVLPKSKVSAETVPSKRWSREWIYFTAVFIAWCFTPLIRRLIDFHNGAFNPVQVTSLIPFLMMFPMAYMCRKKERLARLSPLFDKFGKIWIGTFTYGFLIAASVGSLSAGLFAFIQYIAPMAGGVWIATQELPIGPTVRRLGTIVLFCAAIVSVYGIFQWINPPPWDVLWVDGAEFFSAGPPVPFAMRIFSTLNSPGPAADFFALAMLLALPLLRLRTVWAWPLMASLGAALLLTLVREAWVAIMLGAAVYMVFSPRRLSAVPALALYVGFILFMITSLPLLLGSAQSSDVITSRISTFNDVGHDESALTRQGEIADSLRQGLDNPLGTGLGNIGASARLGPNAQTPIGNVLDSGYMARLIELGWGGFIAYVLVAVGSPFLLAFKLSDKTLSVDAKVAIAIAIALIAALAWGDAAGDAHLGLDGLFFWIAMGIGSLAVAKARDPDTAISQRRSIQKGRLRAQSS